MTSQFPFKFGRRAPDPTHPTINYGSLKSKASDDPSTNLSIEPVDIPSSKDHLEPFNQWLILGNDRFADCNAVVWANQRRLLTSKLGHNEIYPDINQVLEFYRTQNPDFDPMSRENGAGSRADGGMNIQEGLVQLGSEGGPDGVKALAWFKLNPTNVEEIREALATFGSLWLGIRVLDNNSQEYWDGKPWTVTSASKLPTDGGRHAVLAGGYTPEIQFVTWERHASCSQAYWSGSLGKVQLVEEVWLVIWPEHIGTRQFMAGVDFQQLAQVFFQITGYGVRFPVLPFNSLYLVKTSNTGSGTVELHSAGADSSYAKPTVQTATPFTLGESSGHTWVVESEDLYFIKTGNTGTGTVEVHRVSSGSNYTQFDIHQGSGFTIWEAINGSFTIDNGDLYFIKIRNTPSGCVEVQMAGHQRKFNTIGYQAESKIQVEDAANGYLTIRGGDLYFIKTKNTTSGKIEIHCADGEKDYKTLRHYSTAFGLDDAPNGIWDIGTNHDLYFVKTRNPESGRIEVHVATAKSEYQEVLHYASWFGASEVSNGLFVL